MKTYLKLDRYIKDFCYNKSALAKKVGRTPQWLNNILVGKCNLKVDDYQMLCSAMGVDCSTIDRYRYDSEESK